MLAALQQLPQFLPDGAPACTISRGCTGGSYPDPSRGLAHGGAGIAAAGRDGPAVLPDSACAAMRVRKPELDSGSRFVAPWDRLGVVT
jgi:hypothetical protein